MDITLKDYRRGAELKFVLKDVPATIMPKAIDLFAMLLDETTEKQDAEPKPLWSGDIHLGDLVGVNGGAMFNLARAQEEANATLAAEEAPVKKRGRPKKDAAASTTEAEPLAGEPAASEVPLAATTPTATSAPTSEAGANPSGPTSAEPTGGLESVSTPASEPTATAELPEVTDTELQRYSAKLAQHFGAPQKVFDLAAKFVPEGAVPRPTNIRDNAARWEFIKAAQAETGLTFHG